jgi:hypothetical protein
VEKCFALKDSLPELASNGKIAIYLTLDSLVVFVILIKGGFDWPNRGKQEVFMCSFCHCFIFPGEKSKTKDGVKYHPHCPQHSNIGEITNKYKARMETQTQERKE